MKIFKTYEGFINFLQLKGKDKSQVLNNLKHSNLTIFEILKSACKYNIDIYDLYTKDKIKKELTNNQLIYIGIITEKHEIIPKNDKNQIVYNDKLEIDNFYTIKTLPDNLIIKHHFYCRLRINKLPKNLKVEGDFICYDIGLEELPENLYVNGTFDFSDNNVKEIRSDMIINSHIYCVNNNIEKIPDNFYVNGNFICMHNNLSKLPNNLHVEGIFDCSNNFISEISDDLYVYDQLDIRFQNISNTKLKIPKNLDVGRLIK